MDFMANTYDFAVNAACISIVVNSKTLKIWSRYDDAALFLHYATSSSLFFPSLAFPFPPYIRLNKPLISVFSFDELCEAHLVPINHVSFNVDTFRGGWVFCFLSCGHFLAATRFFSIVPEICKLMLLMLLMLLLVSLLLFLVVVLPSPTLERGY